MNENKTLPLGWSHGEKTERETALLKLPRRVRVLLAMEWSQSVLSIFALRMEERMEESVGRVLEEIESARRWVFRLNHSADDARAADRYSKSDVGYADYASASVNYAADAALFATDPYSDVVKKKKWRWLYATYRHALGPEGAVWNPEWSTATARGLARLIRDSRDFGVMPILADALQDAGCDNEDVLNHLRRDATEWTLASWPLWNLFGLGEDI